MYAAPMGRDGHERAPTVSDDGMMCFITEKYAKDLPVGCMLGYVMDGDIHFAYASIEAKIMSCKSALGLQAPPRSAPSIGITRRFVTEHVCDDRWMEMRHALLPLVDGRPKGTTNRAKRGSVNRPLQR